MGRYFSGSRLMREQGVLLGLIAFITLVFVWQLTLGKIAFYQFMVVPTNVLDAWHELNAGQFSWNSAFEFFTLLTAVFLHGDFGHLVGNMFYLWVFGAIASELLGWRWMLFVFVFTGITGWICHVTMNLEESIPGLGASGSVSGFAGLYLAMAVRWRLPNPHVWPIARPVSPMNLAALAALGLMMDFGGHLSGDLGIAYGAHFGGFLGGLLLGGLIVPMPRIALPR